MRLISTRLMIGAAIFLLPKILYAEVVSASEHGFELKFEQSYNVPAGELSQQILNISNWWQAEHTYSGDSENLFIDTDTRHCFCEKLAAGGFVRHMTLANYQPGKQFRFLGGLGPLQSIPVSGVLNFQLIALSPTKTDLQVSYLVASADGRLKGWDKPVASVLQTQLSRLKKRVENHD